MPRKSSIKTLRKKAWDACSKYVRQLYADHNGYAVCYTCDKVDQWKKLHAGHGIDGRHNAVLFDLDIIRPQCFHCNSKMAGCLGGNHKVFTYKMIKQHGLEWWENKLFNARKTVKLNRNDYENLEKDFILKTQQISVNRRAKKWIKKP